MKLRKREYLREAVTIVNNKEQAIGIVELDKESFAYLKKSFFDSLVKRISNFLPSYFIASEDGCYASGDGFNMNGTGVTVNKRAFDWGVRGTTNDNLRGIAIDAWVRVNNEYKQIALTLNDRDNPVDLCIMVVDWMKKKTDTK